MQSEEREHHRDPTESGIRFSEENRVFEGLRALVVVGEAGGPGEQLATELRTRGAEIVLVGPVGKELDAARALVPEVVLVEPLVQSLAGVALARMLNVDPTLRWASILRAPWSRFWPEELEVPDLSELARLLKPLVEGERVLRGWAAKDRGFVTEVDRIGPSRTLRVLVDAGGSWQLITRASHALVEVALCDGEVVHATCRASGSPSVSMRGAQALERYFELLQGTLEVTRRVAAPLTDGDSTAEWLPPAHLVDAGRGVTDASRRVTRRLSSIPPPVPGFDLVSIFETDGDDAGATVTRPVKAVQCHDADVDADAGPTPRERPAPAVGTPMPPPPEHALDEPYLAAPPVPEELRDLVEEASPESTETTPTGRTSYQALDDAEATRLTSSQDALPAPSGDWLYPIASALIVLAGIAIAVTVVVWPTEPETSGARPLETPDSAFSTPSGRAETPGARPLETPDSAFSTPSGRAETRGARPPETPDSAFSASSGRAETPLETPSARELVEHARVHVRAGELAKAEALYRLALEDTSWEPRAMAGLGRVLLATGRSREALGYAERAVDASPNRASYRVLLGDVLLAEGRGAAARTRWLEALRLSPDSRAVRYRLDRHGRAVD